MGNRCALVTVLATAMAFAPDASATGAIVTSPPGASSTVSAHVAVAGASGRTVHWASVEVRGSATKFAWLMPVRNGALLDLASDAWFEALGAATSPRVAPPDVTPPCGIPGGDEVDGDFTHTATAAPEAVAIASDRATLDADLAGWGLAVTSDLSPALDAALTAGSSVVALLYSATSGDVLMRTVRVVDDSPEAIPLALDAAGAQAIDVTAYVFAPGGAALGTATTLTMDPASILWKSDGTSTYGSVRDSLLSGAPGGWLFETGGQAPLFDGTVTQGGDFIPAVAPTYFFRAVSYADATEAPDACAQAAAAWQTSPSNVAAACPAGALAKVGASTCAEVVGAGEIGPGALRCGGIADDLSLALSGLAPKGTWITRLRSVIAASSLGQDVAVTRDATAAPYGPVIAASGYVDPCGSASSSGSSGSSSGTGSATGAGSGGGRSGAPGSSSSGASSDPGPDPGAAAAGGAALDVAAGAADSCGSSSTDPSSDGSGDSCSGGSTGSSDPSSSDSSSGCSSSSTSDSSSSSCDVGPRRHSPTSRIGLLVVAVALLARRRVASPSR